MVPSLFQHLQTVLVGKTNNIIHLNFKLIHLNRSLKQCHLHCFTEITCSAPSPGENTVDLPDDVLDGLSYLQSYTYSCKEGFNTTDDLCTVCQPDGTLSLTNAPVCKGKHLVF